MQNCIQVAAMGPKSPGSRSLFRTVYDKIRQDIVLARLQPGEPLLEEDLAKRLQVSRTPIREALKSDERLSAALGELGRIEEKLTRTKASHIHGFVRLRETGRWSPQRSLFLLPPVCAKRVGSVISEKTIPNGMIEIGFAGY